VPLDRVSKKATVIFGNFLENAAMRAVEQELSKQLRRLSIISMRREKEGNLKSKEWETIKRPMIDTSDWGWFFYEQKGAKGTRITTTAPQMPNGSVLVFKPVNEEAVRLSSWLNHAFVKSGIQINGRAARKGGTGFLAATTNALNRKSFFRQFTVRGGYTKKFLAADETWFWGTPYISVVPKARGTRRRRL